jgi:NitT/TauT family transport system ATP-binding protein
VRPEIEEQVVMTIPFASVEGVAISSVSRTFIGGDRVVRAVDDLSLTIPRGRFVTLFGPSGCGKSTLLRLVAGLLEPDSGEISLFGENVGAARRRKRIGFVPQAPALLPWRTVLENVELLLEVNRQHSPEGARSPREILESFGLGDVLDRHPVELSGGMQQRVAIARAFALAPQILLMDEPFAALDELTRDSLRYELLRQWEQHQSTVLFVTHSAVEAVLLSDEVVVMAGPPGRITATIPVDLERPRPEGIEFTDSFRALELELRAALRRSWVDAP